MGLLTWQGAISIFVLGILGVMAINGDKDVMPIITLIVGAWLPSPTNATGKNAATARKTNGV